MFLLEGRYAEAEMRDQAEIDGIVGNLESGGYRAVLRSMIRTACEVASVACGSVSIGDVLLDRSAYQRRRESFRIGDVLFAEDHAYLVQPEGPRLQVWEIRHHCVEPRIEAFCTTVEESARATLDGRRLRGMGFEWQPIAEQRIAYLKRRRFYPEPELETREPDYSAEEQRNARLLATREPRAFLLRLAQVARARSIDTASEANDSVTQPLLDAGLIQKEYLILCRQDSHTICSVPNRSEIEAAQGRQFTCTICGRFFSDELIEEIYAVTQAGKALLVSSRWMMIWVTEFLMAAGIDRQHIVWNAVAGDDELDIMIDVLGLRIFLELKDREFGLGDAYPFAYRVERYGGDVGVVVSTERVDEEAKRFFREERPTAALTRIDVLEGDRETERQLTVLTDRWSRIAVTQRLLRLSEPVTVNLVPVLQAWMDSRCDAGGPS